MNHAEYDPAPEIWVLGEIEDGKLQDCTIEALDDARQLAAQCSKRWSVVLLGENLEKHIQKLGCYQAEKVYLVEHPRLNSESVEFFLQAIQPLIQQYKPYLLIGSATPSGHEKMARLSARLDVSYLSDCISFRLNEQGMLTAVKPIHAERQYATFSCQPTSPMLLTLRPGVVGVDAPKVFKPPEIIRVIPSLYETVCTTRVIRRIASNPEKIDLREAQTIVAGGRGVKDQQGWNLLRALAGYLEASLAGSRAALDLGWIQRDRMIGQTGKSVKPRLYFAAGISGSYYHLQGVETEILITINQDRNAAIMKNAKIAAVGDLYKILPILIHKIENHLAKGKKDDG